jgi:fumarate hydratase class II
MLPIVYDHTVGDAIEKYSHEYRRPRGIFASIDRPDDIEKAFATLELGKDDVDLIVCSDAEEILAIGGTAVGTGLNAPAGFDEEMAVEIASMTGTPFRTAPNKFTAQGTLDRMVRAHAGLKAAAVTLFKIANDLRWLGSGPRTGLGELIFPANEPGSSIMPGKVNPTQAEAMLMVAMQIIASDVAVTMGGAEGNFELNAFRPILISNYLHSALIIADMCDHFREYMVQGTNSTRPS